MGLIFSKRKISIFCKKVVLQSLKRYQTIKKGLKPDFSFFVIFRFILNADKKR